MNKIQYRNTEKYKKHRQKQMQEWYRKNKDKQLLSNKKCKNKNRDWFKELKSSLKCNRCPENDASCLDFHHKDPNEKEFNIFQMTPRGYGKKKILAEIAKCEVLCANCHRKHHAAERNSGGRI